MGNFESGTETLYAADEAEPPSPRPFAAFANGSVVAGKYLIEKTIAEGGIGIIAVAMHVALQQRVAIKYLKPRALENPTIVERFVREARLAAQIRSDHVVRVHDVGILPSGAPFMVMEYLVGHDLGAVVEAGRGPVATAVDYVLQACDALAEAHALHIVHRDIKPENLFLAQRPSNTPILKIIDFGISKTVPQNTASGGRGRETEAGDRFGTPLYMSPEQLRSTTNVDARSDIWSLGIVLYELLTGALPFEGDDLPQLCASVLGAPPTRLTAVRPDAPMELEAIILKCLEKDRLKRFRNVAEFAQELVPFGPQNAAARAARIVEVIRTAGSSIRPATPLPGSLHLQPMAILMPPLAPANSVQVQSDTAPSIRRRASFPSSRLAVGTLAAAVACSATLAVGVLMRGLDGRETSTSVAVDPTGVPSAAVRQSDGVGAIASASAEVTASSPIPVPPTTVVAPPAAVPGTSGATRGRATPGKAPSATPQGRAASSASPKSRALFGERE